MIVDRAATHAQLVRQLQRPMASRGKQAARLQCANGPAAKLASMEEGRHARCAGRPSASAGTRTACAGSGRGPRARRLRRRPNGEAGATAAPPPPEVTVAQPRVQKLVEWTEFTGRFEAEQRVDVRARVSGYLATIDFQDGQIVEKGQSLFLIDPRPFEVGAGARPGRSRERRGPGRARQAASSSASPSWSSSPAFSPRRTTTSGCRSARPPRRALGAAQAAVEQARLEPRVHADLGADRRAHLRPPGRHRQSGHRGDAAHHDRVAEPDLFRLRHERGRLPRLSARRAGGRAALDPRPLDPGQRQAGRRGRLAPAGPDELRRQRGRPRPRARCARAPSSSTPTS